LDQKAPKFIDLPRELHCICFQHFNRVASMTRTFQFRNSLVEVAQFLLQNLNSMLD